MSYIDGWKIAEKRLENGRTIIVYPLTYGRARLGIGPADQEVFNDEW